jgi:hypothetical protein
MQDYSGRSKSASITRAGSIRNTSITGDQIVEPNGGERQDLIVGVEDKMSIKEYIIYGLQQVLV